MMRSMEAFLRCRVPTGLREPPSRRDSSWLWLSDRLNARVARVSIVSLTRWSFARSSLCLSYRSRTCKRGVPEGGREEKIRWVTCSVRYEGYVYTAVDESRRRQSAHCKICKLTCQARPQTPAAAASLHDVERSRLTRSCKRVCSSSSVSRGGLVLRYRDPRWVRVLFSSSETIATP